MSRGSRRFYRSFLISLAALAVLVWVTLEQFHVPWRDVAGLFLGTLSLAAGTILLAAVFAGIWILLRKWLGRGDAD